MLLKIDFESEIPIYLQLKNQIIEGIAQKELVENDSLPSVRQLAEDIGINMHTVNKTYNMLKDDGFIKLDRRKGAVIRGVAYRVTEEYKNKLQDEMKAVIAEAYCKGMKEEEFKEICSSIFKEYEREKKS